MKYACEYRRCGWVGEDPLRAPDPFNEGCELIACPRCRDMSLHVACDEPGCGDQATCGTPTPNGYRNTCYNHQPTS